MPSILSLVDLKAVITHRWRVEVVDEEMRLGVLAGRIEHRQRLLLEGAIRDLLHIEHPHLVRQGRARRVIDRLQQLDDDRLLGLATGLRVTNQRRVRWTVAEGLRPLFDKLAVGIAPVIRLGRSAK